MLRSVIMTCRVHICDMFDEIPIMASRGLVKYLFMNLHCHHCLFVSFHFYKFHEVMGCDSVLALEFSLKSHSRWHCTGRKRIRSHLGRLMGTIGTVSHLEGLARERLGLYVLELLCFLNGWSPRKVG